MSRSGTSENVILYSKEHGKLVHDPCSSSMILSFNVAALPTGRKNHAPKRIAPGHKQNRFLNGNAVAAVPLWFRRNKYG